MKGTPPEEENEKEEGGKAQEADERKSKIDCKAGRKREGGGGLSKESRVITRSKYISAMLVACLTGL